MENTSSNVVYFGDQQVFAGATPTYTCLLFLDKAGTNNCRFVKVDSLDAWQRTADGIKGTIPAKQVTSAEWTFTVGNGASTF